MSISPSVAAFRTGSWIPFARVASCAILMCLSVISLSGFTSGAITGIVDRLERAGYARREEHPSDRRSVMVCPSNLMEFKEKRVFPIFQPLQQAMAALASRYSETELDAIGSYLRGATAVLQQQTAKLKQNKGEP